MISASPLPFRPVVIALQGIKFAKRTDDLKLRGIDLESGRPVTIKVHFHTTSPSQPDELSDLLLTLTLQRASR
jgi:tRNA (Thr-GGU) A37 N-methylase